MKVISAFPLPVARGVLMLPRVCSARHLKAVMKPKTGIMVVKNRAEMEAKPDGFAH
jgi:hypothetical protein